jgi:hypothetical protein
MFREKNKFNINFSKIHNYYSNNDKKLLLFNNNIKNPNEINNNNSFISDENWEKLCKKSEILIYNIKNILNSFKFKKCDDNNNNKKDNNNNKKDNKNDNKNNNNNNKKDIKNDNNNNKNDNNNKIKYHKKKNKSFFKDTSSTISLNTHRSIKSYNKFENFNNIIKKSKKTKTKLSLNLNSLFIKQKDITSKNPKKTMPKLTKRKNNKEISLYSYFTAITSSSTESSNKMQKQNK